jgi:hypothetical protein
MRPGMNLDKMTTSEVQALVRLLAEWAREALADAVAVLLKWKRRPEGRR